MWRKLFRPIVRQKKTPQMRRFFFNPFGN